MKNTLRQTKSRATRVLHALIALMIVTQLVLSTVMEPPRPGRTGDQWFELHEKFGLGALGVLFFFWIWVVFRSGETSMGMLFPWFSGNRVRAVFADIVDHLRSIRQCNLSFSEHQPLADAVHGLGLITATIMALSGAAGYFLPQADALLKVHQAVSTAMWIFLIVHAGVAVIHEFSRDHILLRMFSFSRK